MAKILAVKARQILDSRGNPTVECDVKTEQGVFRASVPSGASTGANEALELRDHEKAYHGKSVENAVNNVNTKIAKLLIGQNPCKQKELDEAMLKLDGTENKGKLGANAILAASTAVTRAGAAAKEIELYEYIGELYKNKHFTIPIPAFNIINGGKHASNPLDIQEYQILPVGAKTFKEALQMGTEVYQILKKRLETRFGKSAINVGDEGGFAPQMTCVEEPFEFIMDSIRDCGYQNKIKLGIDAAATSFWKNGKYHLEGKDYTAEKLVEKYEELIHGFPIISIEDPFYEEDFENFAKLRKQTRIQIIGDDLTVTNKKRIEEAIKHGSCNCLLLKENQIGSFTETLEAARKAQEAGWNVQVSHRSGGVTDSFIADLAVGINAGQIKSGAPCRGERLMKYNQLLRIEERGVKYAKVKFS